jgi:gamma-glutamyltranspeptidase/glutathione hydrolase
MAASSQSQAAHADLEVMQKGGNAIDAAFATAACLPVVEPRRNFLSHACSEARRPLIGEQAVLREAGTPQPSGTVYVAAADDQDHMVSYIQSNYDGFGSGLAVPGTGIAVQNRSPLFSLDPDHPNVLAPGKRPYHTIIPGFLTIQNQPVGHFGVMGGFMQPQGHVQFLSNILQCHLNSQAALDAARFYWRGGNTVMVESSMPQVIIDGLRERGHELQVTQDAAPFGRGRWYG